MSNYLLWAQAIKAYIFFKEKLSLLFDDAPDHDSKDPTYVKKYNTWFRDNSMVQTWLWNSIEYFILPIVMFHDTAKAIWVDLKETYGQDKNISRIYDLYERMFTYSIGDKSLTDYYGGFKGLIEEIQAVQSLSLISIR